VSTGGGGGRVAAYTGSNSRIRSIIVGVIFIETNDFLGKSILNKNKASTPCMKAAGSTEAHESSAEEVPETLALGK
jgi:hypothetical protein